MEGTGIKLLQHKWQHRYPITGEQPCRISDIFTLLNLSCLHYELNRRDDKSDDIYELWNLGWNGGVVLVLMQVSDLWIEVLRAFFDNF